MSQESIIRAGYGAWRERDLEAWLEQLDPQVELLTTGAFPDLEPAYRGHDGLRNFWDAMQCQWTAHGVFHVFSGAFDRHDDVVLPQLRIFDHFARSVNDAVCKVSLIEDFPPVRHRLCGEDFVQNGRKLARIRHLFGWIRESRVR